MVVFICFSFLSGSSEAFGQWSDDNSVNNQICTAGNEQVTPSITTDGHEGAIIVWKDRRSGDDDIYVQHIDSAGVTQWPTDGVLICNAVLPQSGPVLVSDGKGGAIITWLDVRDGVSFHVYAQRINAAGVVQWTTNGVAICTAANSQAILKIIEDGSGGAIISWLDRRTASGKTGDMNVYAQRIDSTGAVQWTVDGVGVCTQTDIQNNPTIASDGAGGAIIAWDDIRNGAGNNDIFAQRINNAGLKQWSNDGVLICNATDIQQIPVITSDNLRGAIISWEDKRNGDLDIYAQQIDSAGVTGWTSNGITVCTATNDQSAPRLVSDNAGGVVICWIDNRNESAGDIYVQHIDASGAVLWTTNGNPVSVAVNEQRAAVIASDENGGAIISWHDRRGSNSVDNYDIYAQRVLANGTMDWTTNGVIVSIALIDQTNPAIISVGRGNSIVSWRDGRNNTQSDIYAQRITYTGRAGDCTTPSIFLKPLALQTVCQYGVPVGLVARAVGDDQLTYQWYSNTTASNVGGTLIPGATDTLFTPPTNGAGTFYYFVEMADLCNINRHTASTVIVNPAPVLLATHTDIVCSGPSTASIDLAISGAVSPYTYEWTGAGVNTSSEDQTGLGAGVYKVTVTDSAGCASKDTITILNTALIVNAGADTSLCNGSVLLTANTTNSILSGPASPVAFAEVSGSSTDKRIFTGNIDYIAIGNTFSQSENRNNCGRNTSASQVLSLPSGAIVRKAYLYWSGSGTVDSQVKLNGVSVTADNTKSFFRPLLFNYFAARKDVTSLVAASGTYTVSDLNWNNNLIYCVDNSAFGGWALVVIYEKDSLPATKIHINTEKFQFTYPAGNYTTTINNISVPGDCNTDARFTIVGFEGDNYIGDSLTIGGQSFGNNNFRGQSGANLDILSWNIPLLITSGSTSLTYSINTYLANTAFGPSVDGLFDYVKVLKYNICPPPCSAVKYQWFYNGDAISADESITASLAGTYVVKAIDCSGCIAIDTVTVSECQAGKGYMVQKSAITALSEKMDEAGFGVSVQPNPATDYFNLTIKGSDNVNPITVNIFDSYDRIIRTYNKVQLGAILKVNAGNWHNGIYFAEIIQGGKRKVVKLIRVN
ncbi:MAG: T9SS type A sorting domain-containing protein [Chitinophagaceae bacterium]